jgi:hypothetical protein
MKLAIFHRYDSKTGNATTHEMALPDHVTVTGDEDHFALAYHDAKMILSGLRYADHNARWRIISISNPN